MSDRKDLLLKGFWFYIFNTIPLLFIASRYFKYITDFDGFLTIYGEKPDGVELSKEHLLNLFGSKTRKLYEIDEQWQQTDDPKEKEKLRKQIAKEAESKIYIDYKDGAKNGIIKIYKR